MPTYEYRCKSCGHELEVVQSFTDDALTDCPSCGGPLRKVFGSIGVTFKGSGFYKTDNRSSGTRPSSGSSSSDSSSGDSSGGAAASGSSGSDGAGSSSTGNSSSSSSSSSSAAAGT